MTNVASVWSRVQLRSVTGTDVVQLYLHESDMTILQPVKKLEGFGRVTLAPGETQTATFTLDRQNLGYYDHFTVQPRALRPVGGDGSVGVGLDSAGPHTTFTLHSEQRTARRHDRELPVAVVARTARRPRSAFRRRRLVQFRPMAFSPRRRSTSLPGHLPQARPGEVLVWTDGACQRNPGPGGWAALVCWEDGIVEEHSGGLALTTNNIMEMTAALEGLRALPSGSRVCVVTDSRYLHDGMTSWMAGWKRRGWRTASGEPVKNKEIWVALETAASSHEQVRWHWVKGHTGHALNERADVLAVAATQDAARLAG